jgi:SAM-dependent methyltransferase
MTWLDRFIQRWRIRKASRYIPHGGHVLDIGTADGTLFHMLPHLRDGIGVDPDLDPAAIAPANAQLIRGMFPADVPKTEPFDAITLLAVLEHIPAEAQQVLAKDCHRYLRRGGRVVITVPSPQTDHLLNLLQRLHLVHGMSLEQHYGFDAATTTDLFTKAGFRTFCAQKFQLGLNNLFVFEKT